MPHKHKVYTGTAPAVKAMPVRQRILVAEDNPANQAVLRLQLDILGFDADIASDGAIALALYQANVYPLILADRNMPKMDGLELTRAIRTIDDEHSASVPIIAITAVHYAEEIATCHEAGMNDALPKPIELDVLRTMLMRWLPEVRVASRISQDQAPNLNQRSNVTISTQILDLSCFRRVMGDIDTQKMRALLNLFIKTARSDLSSCRHQLDLQQWRAIASTMHKLKSSAGALGALRFSKLATAIDEAVKAERFTEISGLMVEIADALNEVALAVEQATDLSLQASALSNSHAK